MWNQKLVFGVCAGIVFAGCGEGDEGLWGTDSSAVAPPTHNAQVVANTIPLAMNPGEKRNVSVTMLNTGVGSPTDDWIQGQHYLRSSNVPLNEWRWILDQSTSDTTVGNQHTFQFRITAPAANPNADFSARMFVNMGTGGQNGFFGNQLTVPNINVDAAVQRQWDCAPVDTTEVPTTMQPGERRTITVTVQNTGTDDWTANNFCLRAQNTPLNLWGSATCSNVAANVPSGANGTFTFAITAPATPGTYAFERGLFGFGGVTVPGGIGYFDDNNPCIDATVDVEAATGAPWDSQVVTEDFPRQMIPGQSANVSVRMRNTGANTWTNTGDFFLYSRNTPLTQWDIVNDPVTANTTSGNDFTFTFRITAPATPGTYSHRWQMIGFGQTPAAGFFGELIDIPIDVVVGGCGNGVTEPPLETCDDGNTMPGDGCDAACQIEPQFDDLSTGFADRLFTGNNVDNVAIGEISGDAIVDIIVAQPNGLDAQGQPERANAGTLFGYLGAVNFFATPVTTTPTAAAFYIEGATDGDLLGARSEGSIIVGNVYAGGGPQDLIASASFADGVMDMRADCGEVYVFNGAGLNGYIDLDANPAELTARIIGPVVGGQARVLDVADANGDGFDDLLIGVPFAAPLGRVDAGEVYLIRGGPTLTGTVDLATVAAPTLLAYFQGENGAVGMVPGDRLGKSGAIGNLRGTAAAEVVLGAATYSAIQLRAGAAYVFEGPVGGTYDLTTQFTIRYRSPDVVSAFGQNVAIGQVRGNAVNELVIAGNQLLSTAVPEPDSQRGGVLVLEGPLALGDFIVGKGTFYPLVDTRIFGEDRGDGLGSSLVLGDLNGDGFADLLSGAYASDGFANGLPSSGSMTAVLGSENMALTFDFDQVPPNWLVHGPRTPALLGRNRQSVAAGDLNADGRDDFCVGVSNGGNEVYCFMSPW